MNRFRTLLALAVLAAGCGDEPPPTVPNRPPVAVGSIPAVTVAVDSAAAVDVAGYFSDPDGDALAYAAASSDTARATVSVAGSVLTAVGVAKGQATVTVTASDGGASAQQTFAVTVPNRLPVAVGSIPPLTVRDSAAAVDVAGYFSDPDGDALAYAGASSDTARATVTMAGSVLTVARMAKGEATVTVTASDGEGASAQQTLAVTVPNRPPVAVGSIAALTVAVDSVAAVDMEGYFDDADGDSLAYAAASSDTTRVAASVAGSVLRVAGVAKGEATVTATASDGGGASAQQALAVTVPNRPPVAGGFIPALTVRVDNAAAVDVEGYFGDPDGDSLVYAAVSSDTTRVAVSVVGSVLTVAGVAKGEATVTVTASDGGGASAQHALAVTVFDDREVLEALYHAFCGPDWLRQDKWLSDAPLVEWHGVGWSYDQGRVSGLDLGNNQVCGDFEELVSMLVQLDALEFFAAPGNFSLTGQIPRSLMSLPLKRLILPHTVCAPDDPVLREWLAEVAEGVYECDVPPRLPRVILSKNGNGVSLRLPDGHAASVPSVSAPGVVDVSVTSDESGVWLDIVPVGIGEATVWTGTLPSRVTVREPVGSFGIDLVMGDPNPLNAERKMLEAVEWWEYMLDGSDMPEQQVKTCVLRDSTGASMVRANAADFLLVTKYRPRGSGAAVGGPCDVGEFSGNTTVGRPPATGGTEPSDGVVSFDVFRHEIGHALGLAGLIAASHPNLLVEHNGTKYFTGKLATQEYRRAGGDPNAPGVPLDGPHWPMPDVPMGHTVHCLPRDRRPNAISMYALMDVGYVVDRSKIIPLQGLDVSDYCSSDHGG